MRISNFRNSRKSRRRLGSYVQSKVRMPINFIINKGITYTDYYSKKPENVFPKPPNYLKYFPQKIINPPKADTERLPTMNDFESISSYSSDTVVKFKVHSDMEVEFKKDVRYVLLYKGLGKDDNLNFKLPRDEFSETSEETDSSFFSTHVSSISTSFPIEKESESLPHRPCSPKIKKSEISSISEKLSEPKLPSVHGLCSGSSSIDYQDFGEEAEDEADVLEFRTISCLSPISKISLKHPLDVYPGQKEPDFQDILATSLRQSRADLHHLFPDYSGLVNKSITEMDDIDDSINALSCEELLPGEDVSDFSPPKWLPFTREQEKYGKRILKEGGELFSSISSDTVIGRKMKKKCRPKDSISSILVKDSKSGLSYDALEDHKKKPVLDYYFELDKILSEEDTLKAGCRIPGKSSELSLNAILGIH